MRTPLVAGNWKMNKTVEQACPLAAAMLPGLQAVVNVERVICPPFTALMPLAAMLEGSGIELGAQNLFWEPGGAFTGEISPEMVKEFCRYVILGHSERRQYFYETDESVNRKLKASLQAGLIPIVCVGETLEQNDAGETFQVVTRQVREGLKGLDAGQAADIVIAYEPVWAIGTGRAASKEDASAVIGGVIRPAVKSLFGVAAAEGMRILYGGSVKGENAAEFFSHVDIDGALVGGASLKADEFIQIVRAAAG
ncbi:MAG: triose-phosphate isomerase [Anaerolineaceae bacterium]|nr:triose-phosphate isomerase [Anaerolineaceae bacterium]